MYNPENKRVKKKDDTVEVSDDTPHTYLPNLDLSLAIEDINSTLISSCLPDSSAPKILRDIFVCPPLTLSSDNLDKEAKTISLESLLDDKNYIIVGKKESGKTMLLNFLLQSVISRGDKLIPVYLRFSEINKNNPKSLFKIIANFLSLQRQNTKDFLQTNRLLLLIDDIDYDDTKRIKILTRFLENHSNFKIITTISETFHGSLGMVNNLPSFLKSTDNVFVQPFGNKEVFKLIDKWFSNSNRDLKELKMKILGILNFTNIPKNPLNISLLLWIIEKSKKDSKQINKAVLVEAFIETVLEKFSYDNFNKQEIIDFRTKEYFLAFLAERMVMTGVYDIPYDELVNITKEYFTDLGDERVNIKDVIEYFLSRGLLVGSGNLVTFRFRCVGEFFIAKRMIESNEFYRSIVTKDRYLLFGPEIEYLTGIQRNNSELLKSLLKWTEEYFLNMVQNGEIININKFEDLLNVELSAIDDESLLLECLSAEDDFIVDEVAQLPVPVDERDQALTKVSTNIENEVKYFESLIILSSTLKNCEFVSKEIKTDVAKKCIEKWAAMIIYSMIRSEEFTKQNIREGIEGFDMLNEKEKNRLKSNVLKSKDDELSNLIKFLTPIFLQSAASDKLGTEKLQYSLKQIIFGKNNILITFIATFVYADLGLPSRVKYIKELIEKAKHNKKILRLIYMKLLSLYITDKNANRIEKVIIDLYVDYIISEKNPILKNAYRQKFIQDLKKKRNLRK